jgi:hypothetical protein
VRSLSDYFDEKGISAVDLLKLDVECRERAVLAGIPMEEVLGTLESKGFSSHPLLRKKEEGSRPCSMLEEGSNKITQPGAGDRAEG